MEAVVAKKEKRFRVPVRQIAKPVETSFEEDEPEFNLYESLKSAFVEVRLIIDGKQKRKSLDELIEELRKEEADELRNRSDQRV